MYIARRIPYANVCEYKLDDREYIIFNSIFNDFETCVHIVLFVPLIFAFFFLFIIFFFLCFHSLLCLCFSSSFLSSSAFSVKAFTHTLPVRLHLFFFLN